MTITEKDINDCTRNRKINGAFTTEDEEAKKAQLNKRYISCWF